MLVSPTTQEVRWIVEQSFQRYFALTDEDLEDLVEIPMIEDGRCIARSYRVSNLLAMWLKEVGILQFYDDQGRMLRRANLFAEVEPRAAAA
jgi:acetylornithine deacetylase/succinyl-diaminopimelate desuccinylase-like protein